MTTTAFNHYHDSTITKTVDTMTDGDDNEEEDGWMKHGPDCKKGPERQFLVVRALVILL
jgi:hypothetical protein